MSTSRRVVTLSHSWIWRFLDFSGVFLLHQISRALCFPTLSHSESFPGPRRASKSPAMILMCFLLLLRFQCFLYIYPMCMSPYLELGKYKTLTDLDCCGDHPFDDVFCLDFISLASLISEYANSVLSTKVTGAHRETCETTLRFPGYDHTSSVSSPWDFVKILIERSP